MGPGPGASSSSTSSTRTCADSFARSPPTPIRSGSRPVILGAVASPELSVVCRSCGSEVSPYVTECPYCGTRLRKRAPKLERRGDELTAREGMRDRRRRRAAQRRERRGFSIAADCPVVTIAAILLPALVLIVERATDL